jgi:hypothetical protein
VQYIDCNCVIAWKNKKENEKIKKEGNHVRDESIDA